MSETQSERRIERVCLAQDTRIRIEEIRCSIKKGRWGNYHAGNRVAAVLTGRQHPLRIEQITSGSVWWRLYGDIQWEGS